MLSAGNDVFGSEDKDLAGLYVADKLCANCRQGTALRGDHIAAVLHPAVAQRPESVRIPRADQLLRRHDDQGIRALKRVHSPADGLLNGRRAKTLPGNDVGDGLGVAGRVKNSAGELQLRAELCRVGKISIVRNSHVPFLVVDLYRLTIPPAGRAGRSVPGVRHGNIAFRKAGEHIPCKDFTYQPEIFVGVEDPVFIDNNAAAFLASVLQCIQAQIAQHRHISRSFCHHAENTAFLVDLHSIIPR